MMRRMVVLPYEVARSIIERNQGHNLFDLKHQDDLETVDRLNRSLNLAEGKEKDNGVEKKKQEVKDHSIVTDPKPVPATPDSSARKSSQSISRRTLRQQLRKTGAFDPKSKQVITLEGQSLPGTHIDQILDKMFGVLPNAEYPKGSKEIGERLKYLGVKDLPDQAFMSFITSPAATPRRTRQKKSPSWIKF